MNRTVTIGPRLVSERKRKGLNQAAFASLGGVSVKTQVLYEKSERVPDATYLAAVAEHGVDVLYVLSGVPSGAALTDEETAILSGYRALDTIGRAGVLALIGGMQNQTPSNVRIKGEVGQYVEGDLTVTQPFTINMGRKKKKE